MKQFGRLQVKRFVDAIREIIEARGAKRAAETSSYEWELNTKHGVLRLSFEDYLGTKAPTLLFIHTRFDEPERANPVCLNKSGKWNWYANKTDWENTIDLFRDNINNMTEKP